MDDHKSLDPHVHVVTIHEWKNIMIVLIISVYNKLLCSLTMYEMSPRENNLLATYMVCKLSWGPEY